MRSIYLVLLFVEENSDMLRDTNYTRSFLDTKRYLNIYCLTKAKVVTKNFQTDPFSFKKGVTQGDPISPIIFILVFQPIIDFLITQEQYGYNINDKSIMDSHYDNLTDNS